MRPSRSVVAASLLVIALGLLELRGSGTHPAPVRTTLGSGPTLVMVHGLGSRADHWLPVARLLARRFRVVLVELPGHGASGMPEPFSLEGATTALEQAIDAASPDLPVVLIGHSIGGLVATATALDRPQRVRGLVLVETALKPQVTPEERERILLGLDHDYRGVLHAAYLAFGRDSAQGERLFAEAAAEDSFNLKRWIRLAVTADLSERAAALAMPVLAVLAPHSWAADEPWPATAAELGYGRIPDLHPARIENSGHFIMLDQPAALARLIERFASHGSDESVAAR